MQRNVFFIQIGPLQIKVNFVTPLIWKAIINQIPLHDISLQPTMLTLTYPIIDFSLLRIHSGTNMLFVSLIKM